MRSAIKRITNFFFNLIIFNLLIIYVSTNTLFAKESITIVKNNIPSQTDKVGTPYIKCAMDKTKHSYLLQSVPWKRAQFGTKNGDYDGFIMAAKNNTRDSYAVFVKTPITIKWLYVVKKDKTFSPKDSDFVLRPVGSLAGSAVYNWAAVKHKNIKEFFDLPKMIILLDKNRIDVALLNSFQIKDLNLNMENYKTYVIKKKTLGIYFGEKFLSKKPKFLEKFKNNMKKCAESVSN